MKKNLICVLLFSLLFFSILPATRAFAAGVDYQLPYPGILPDSPFYIFKLTRDNIVEFFISNPIKKAEFDIDKADVRMSAAFYLAEQKKSLNLIEPAINSAENYFRKALSNTKQAKAQGMDVGGVVKRQVRANLKYQEVINEIEKKIDKKERGKIEAIKIKLESLEVSAKVISQ